VFSIDNLEEKFFPKNKIYVFTINSEAAKKQDSNLVGYCNSDKHKGCLSIADIEEHQCIEKECPWLMKLGYREKYWDKVAENLVSGEKQKESRKKKQQYTKNKEKTAENRSRIFVQRGNEWLKGENYDKIVEIAGVRVDKDKKIAYVNYVAEHFLEYYDFCDIYTHFRVQTGMKTELVRVRNPDGSYATFDDWHKSEKYKEMKKAKE